jgi:predicted transcriptional regulator
MEVSELKDIKKLVEDIKSTQEEQGKEFIKKFTEQKKETDEQKREIIDFKEENRLNIQRLTTDIDNLKAEVCIAIIL